MIYSPAQKAVAVLLAIGEPEATAVLARMSKAETDMLLSNSRTMRSVFPDDLATISRDFEEAFNRAETIFDAGPRFDQLVSGLDESDEATVAKPVTNLTEENAASYALSAFDDVTCDEIGEFLAGQDILIVSIVLSRLAGDKAGEVLQMLDGDLQADIFKVMATQGEVQEIALQAIDQAAIAFFNAKKNASNAAKLSSLAKVLNSIDRDAADNAIRSLEDTFEKKEISTLKSMLFRFGDIIKLESSARSAVFDAISADLITLALRDTSEDVREAVLSSISQRTRRIIENDLKSQSKASPSEVRSAQKLIVSQILNLAANGSIKIHSEELAAA